MVNLSFTAGFFDELVKTAEEAWRSEYEKRFGDIQRRFGAEMSRIWDKDAPQKLLAAVKRRFPKFQETAKPPKAQSISKVADLADTFQHIVHHPLVQALGYGALASEGAHAIAHTYGTPKMQRWAGKSRIGKAIGLGTIGASSAFLGAEGLSALADLFHKKPKPPKVPKIKIVQQPPDLPDATTAMVKNRRDAGLRVPKIPALGKISR